jgi:hypothetical protein
LATILGLPAQYASATAQGRFGELIALALYALAETAAKYFT